MSTKCDTLYELRNRLEEIQVQTDQDQLDVTLYSGEERVDGVWVSVDNGEVMIE